METNNTKESAKKVLREYYGYKSEQDVPDGLAAVLEDWLHHQLQKAREESLRKIIEVRNDPRKSTKDLIDLIDKYHSELNQDKV